VILRHLEALLESGPLLARYTGEHRLGMKTGKGFYEWTPEAAQHFRDRLTQYLQDAIHRGDELDG